MCEVQIHDFAIKRPGFISPTLANIIRTRCVGFDSIDAMNGYYYSLRDILEKTDLKEMKHYLYERKSLDNVNFHRFFFSLIALT